MRRVPKRRIRLWICGLAFLAIAEPAAAAADPFDGVYAGKRTLVSGPRNCPGDESVSVTIQGEVLTFTNSQLQNYPLDFEPHPDGKFALQHVDIGGDIVDIQGRITGSVLEADVTNPPCVHHWRLERK
jgi:hypothetical protein